MIIGVPKEIKPDENRVSLPPDKVEVLVTDGHKVLVESGPAKVLGFQMIITFMARELRSFQIPPKYTVQRNL